MINGSSCEGKFVCCIGVGWGRMRAATLDLAAGRGFGWGRRSWCAWPEQCEARRLHAKALQNCVWVEDALVCEYFRASIDVRECSSSVRAVKRRPPLPVTVHVTTIHFYWMD